MPTNDDRGWIGGNYARRKKRLAKKRQTLGASVTTASVEELRNAVEHINLWVQGVQTTLSTEVQKAVDKHLKQLRRQFNKERKFATRRIDRLPTGRPPKTQSSQEVGGAAKTDG